MIVTFCFNCTTELHRIVHITLNCINCIVCTIYPVSPGTEQTLTDTFWRQLLLYFLRDNLNPREWKLSITF